MSRNLGSIQPQRLKKLLRSLVDIYSPSGKEEEILHFLHGYLRRRGLSVLRQPVDDNRHNLLVMPREEDIRLAVIGHLDTVTAYDLDHYSSSEKGDMIRGLGTADMKGGCAAMVEAYLSYSLTGVSSPPVALCLLVGEEEEGDGAERLVEDFQIPWAIIGEPTDLMPCLSHYGYIEVQICAYGKRMHASLADMKENPIQTMLRLILRISHYMEKKRPQLVYNIRDLFSSQTGFSVPDECEAWLDIHMPPSTPIGEIASELEEIVALDKRDHTHANAVLRTPTIDAGYELPEKGAIIEALQSVYAQRSLPWNPRAFRSHSDANRLWAAGVKTILLGPGSLAAAHTPNESVAFQQVCEAAQLYLDLFKTIAP